MPIEAKCPGCDRLLRVSDEYAGKQARCPVCNAIYSVPELPVAVALAAAAPSVGTEVGEIALEAAVIEPEPPPPDNFQWYMKTPEGQTFGPAKRPELDKWVSEGRVTADCELQADEGPWQTADLVYAVLRAPTTNNSPPAANSGGVNAAPATGNPAYMASHRGGVILALAIMGFVSACPILSIMAWVMGNGDLREMREGRMDPEGQGLTYAGYVLGMILSGVWILVAVISVFVMLVIVAGK